MAKEKKSDKLTIANKKLSAELTIAKKKLTLLPCQLVCII